MHISSLQNGGVKFDAHYSVTSVDPPELIYFMKEHYPDVIWDRHYWPDNPKYNLPNGSRRQITMWNLIASHTIPPTRVSRYCCDKLKESSGKGRVTVTGVRWAESINRRNTHGLVDVKTKSKKIIEHAIENNPSAKLNKRGGLIFMDDNKESREIVESCFQKRKVLINPVLDWEESDVWEFLNDVAKVPHCCLYDEGFTRIGCIGCPLQGRKGMIKDFERWPRYKQLYIRAFDMMIQNHPGMIRVASGEPAEKRGTAYTQDGSHGRHDGEELFSVHEIGNHAELFGGGTGEYYFNKWLNFE